MIDLLHETAQTLRNNKLRTALTGLSVAWGIFMLIILLGAARGVTNAVSENMSSVSNNSIEVYGGFTTKAYRGYKEGRNIELRSGDIAPIQKENSKVGDVLAFASVDTARISNERGALDRGFTAVYERAIDNYNLTMLAGRFINGRDIAECRRVLVLCDKDARYLFDSVENAIGKTVRCMGLAWTVVGVYTHQWRSGSSYGPYTTYKALTGNNDNAYRLTAFVDDVTNEAEGDEVEQGIRSTLSTRHQFSPDDRTALWINNNFKWLFASQKSTMLLNLAVWLIGIFTLLTGIVGVSNIMFVSVRERTHEIGIRRAIGAKPRSILTQILTESIAITGLFGYIGIVLGMAILQVIDAVFKDSEGFSNPTVDISIAIKVTIALIIAGAFAGLFPALKAIKVKPVEALRDE